MPLAVYVHVPFCTVKCGYCDFNAYAGLHHLAPAYRDAVLAEIAGWADVISEHSVTSVYFGGGTPSEVPAAHIAAFLDALRALAPFAAGCEVSLEANPGTLDERALAQLADAGVNRLSLGAQSFRPQELAFLDRIHSPEAAAAAVRMARRAGFESVSLDLIYGLPGQSGDELAESITAALVLEPDHVSLYSLTVEEGTPLDRRVARGAVVPLDGDAVAGLWDRAGELLRGAGFVQYEVSNWARTGHESQHNRAYWTDQAYLGIGAGAHGYIGGARYRNVDHPAAYIRSLAQRQDGALHLLGRERPGLAAIEGWDARTDLADWVALRLRLAEGFAPGEFEAAFGASPEQVFGPVLEAGRYAGVLASGERIRLTAEGFLLHGELCARLIAHLAGLPSGEVPVRASRRLAAGTRP